ncbi:MAG: FtsX-like permease family protein [Candidatus Marinimicrobia bacterium]|nr:FtsX-like permease family protein [Candidatus Neomarinimicrobiota bacterium]
MIKFLIKGILRDRSRSLLPVLVVTLAVAMIIFFQGFMNGIINSMFLDSAVVSTGHVKVITKGYKEESQLLPNDLALLGTKQLIDKMAHKYQDYFWTPRITFGGLLDVPDENGETQAQGPVFALGIDFLSPGSRQIEIWELERRLRDGRLPENKDEVLLSTRLADRLGLSLGNSVTLIGSTMHNAFTTYNFIVVGTFKLNLGPVDRQMMLVDISGARLALDMEDAASEILGYTNSLFYDDTAAVALRQQYNKININNTNIFSPTMMALRDTKQMGVMVDWMNAASGLIVGVFLVISIIVLWNMGLMNGLRRYGEIGMRLALGESKGQVYRSMVVESAIIGSIGTVIGTTMGIGLTYYMQEVGLDYSKAMESLASTEIIMSNVFYAQITPELYYAGIIPGVLSTVLGTMLAGRAIYKREMAQLFKELET